MAFPINTALRISGGDHLRIKRAKKRTRAQIRRARYVLMPTAIAVDATKALRRALVDQIPITLSIMLTGPMECVYPYTMPSVRRYSQLFARTDPWNIFATPHAPNNTHTHTHTHAP